MKEDEFKNTWQYSELKAFFDRHSGERAFDSKTVFLANPAEKKLIDCALRDHLWQGVLKGVGTSEIWIKALEGTFPQSGIEYKQALYTSGTLTFLLEDPKRQISFQSNVPWYCRGKIQCSITDYMISFNFYVYFPEDFSFAKMARLLKNANFEGLPPDLSYNRSIHRAGIFSLAFSKGSGAGWGLHNYEQASNKIRDEIKLIIEVIRAIYNLEKDYKSTKAFNELEKSLVLAFASG